MVIKDVTDGISIKINELFGDEYEIYDNNTEQGMEKPCFLHKIDCINIISKIKLICKYISALI